MRRRFASLSRIRGFASGPPALASGFVLPAGNLSDFIDDHVQILVPAVLGIQAAPQPPRYAPISRVRAIMKEKKLGKMDATLSDSAGLTVLQMSKPQSSSHAQMIEGDTDTIVARIVGIIAERGLMQK